MAEIGVGMLGHAFMGKAHSNAFRKLEYIAWPPPLVPRLVAIAGRNQDAVSEAAQRYGYERWRPTGTTSSRTTGSGSSTTAARTRSMPSRRSPPPKRASTSSARSRSRARLRRATRCGAASRPRASSTSAGSITASSPPCASRAS